MSKYGGFPSSPLKSRMARPETDNDPLPHGWEMLIDPESHQPFFVDHTNRRTSWKDPRPSRMQEFVESAMGGDNFFRSHFEQRSPFWQSQLDPFGSRVLNRSPRGSPSIQRRTPAHSQDIRRSPSPQPGGRHTPPLEVRMSRLYTHEQPHENFPRHSQQRTRADEHYHMPQYDQPTVKGERVINIPIRLESGAFINVPTHMRYRGPPQEPLNTSRIPPQTMPKPESRQPSEGQEIPIHIFKSPEDGLGENCNQQPTGLMESRYHGQPPDMAGASQKEHEECESIQAEGQIARNHVQPPDLANTSQQEPEDCDSIQAKGQVSENQLGGEQQQEEKTEAQGTDKTSSSHQEKKSMHEGEMESEADMQPSDKNLKSSEESPQVLHIREILSKILDLRQEIEDFMGRRGSKDYLRIEEKLMRLLLDLDNVDTMGDEHIRAERRMGVVTAQTLLSRLEKRAIPQDC